jgi:hypothetical protein
MQKAGIIPGITTTTEIMMDPLFGRMLKDVSTGSMPGLTEEERTVA